MAERLTDYGRLLDAIVRRMQDATRPFLVGIAGPPATGKSTLAERLVADLAKAGHAALFCPMDGFHLTNAQLDEAGLRSAKGRIDTFDGPGFAAAVSRLQNRVPFWWPLYSRQSHDPIAKGTRIEGTEAAFVIEGNYVLGDDEPWGTAAKALDLRIFVDASDALLRQRLMTRHQRSGRSETEALEKIANTDMPNARAIRDGRGDVDILYCERADA
jgi:pantothenate kinase